MADVKSFRPAPVVDLAVGWNGGGRGLSARLAQIADRYVEILRHCPPPALSEAEMNAVRDAMNGVLLQPAAVIDGGIAIEVEDAMPGLAAKWGVDGLDLCKKLQQMSYPQSVALLEQVEMYWSRARHASGA